MSSFDDQLLRLGMQGIDVRVFDAANDEPSDLTAFLTAKIEAARTAEIDNAYRTIEALDQMLANVKEAQALAALSEINKELSIFADRHRELAPSRRAVQVRLLDAVRAQHPRTVWAATRRAGAFWNFNVYQYLGDGAAASAKRRAADAIGGLREIIKNRIADSAYEAARGFLRQVLDNVTVWEADFIKAARHHGVAVLEPDLSSATELWSNCEEMYGTGVAFRDEVARSLEAWFEKHEDLQAEIDRRIKRAWKSSVLIPLRAAVGAAAPEVASEISVADM